MLGHEIPRFGRDESGATAVEYGLIAALVVIAVIAAIFAAGNGLGNLFGGVRDRSMPVLDEADV